VEVLGFSKYLATANRFCRKGIGKAHIWPDLPPAPSNIHEWRTVILRRAHRPQPQGKTANITKHENHTAYLSAPPCSDNGPFRLTSRRRVRSTTAPKPSGSIRCNIVRPKRIETGGQQRLDHGENPNRPVRKTSRPTDWPRAATEIKYAQISSASLPR